MNPPYLRLLVLSLTLIPLSGTPSGKWNKPFPKQEGGYDQRISQPNDTAGTLGIPDSTCYFADFSLMAESMSLLMGETQHSATVAKKSAPFYLFPSPAVRQDMNKLQPLLMESLELKARIAASASAFDAAWEEVITCASLESEEGVRSALAIAFQHKAELDQLQKKLDGVTEEAKKAGEPRDPVAEWKKLEKEHQENLTTAQKALVKKGSPAPAPAPAGKGVYKLIDIKNNSPEKLKVTIQDGIIKVKEEHTLSTGETTLESIEFYYPQVIYPEKPVELTIRLEFRPEKLLYFQKSSTARVDLVYGAHPLLGVPAHWKLMNVWHHVPVHFEEKQKLKILKYTEDKITFSLPDRQKLLQAIREKRKPVWEIPLRDQQQFMTFEGGYSSFSPPEMAVTKYNLLEMYNPTIPADMKVLTMDSQNAGIHFIGTWINVYLMYQWSDDGAPGPASPDALAEKSKKYKIEEIEGNMAFIRGNISAFREQLGKETDPGVKARLSYQIMTSEADLQAEEDLKKSVLTGQYVHTRTGFDDFVRGQFIENIRTEQMRMEEYQRCSASLQRMAALLPPADADGARDFIARQVTPSDVMNMDVAKLRKITDILYKQVEARATQEAAKGEEEAAQVGLNWANRFKTAADAGMMATSLVAGPWLNVAYQGGTGAWEGGLTEGILRAASSYSIPSFLAAQAYQGYQAGGWTQAGENVAISFVTGKVIQYGLAKSLTAAGKLLSPSSQESYRLAQFNQARQQGEALVKNLQRTEGEVIRLRVALQNGQKGAAQKLKQALATREAQAAAIHENMHAKNFLKYKGDYHTRQIFTEDLDLIHQKTQEKFHAAMQARGWNKTPLKEFRNASSAGTSGMDYDIGLDEKLAGALTKNGSKATLQQWQKEAQPAWNQAYKEITGRSAIRSWETVTTSIHPEAYKELAWLSGNPGAAGKLWAQQAVDVTRFKNWHMMNDEALTVYEKLQEVCRGSAKDMSTKLLGNLSKLANAGGPNGPALKKANDHWRKVFGVLDKFGKGDLDPLSASRQIRELSGGKSITEVLDDMTTLMETVGKL